MDENERDDKMLYYKYVWEDFNTVHWFRTMVTYHKSITKFPIHNTSMCDKAFSSEDG